MVRKFLLMVVVVAMSAVSVYAEDSVRPVKYVFFLIGDGMGVPQRQLPELVTGEKLLMNQFPVSASTQTASATAEITDSAAAGTALSAGVRTNNGVLGLDPEGKPVQTIAEFALKQGYKVGILSSATLNHATPAAFYAHVAGRGQADDISADLIRSNFDFFGGNGLDASKGSKPAYDLVREAGYNVVNVRTAEELAAVKVEGKTYIYRTFGEVLADREKGVFTLADVTAKAIEALDNPEGFFIMVEGAQIDWRCHSNCPAGAVAEAIDFNEVVKVAYAFYEKHPEDTLVIVTADHETGGLAITAPEKLQQLREESPELLAHFLSREASYGALSVSARTLREQKASFEEVLATIGKQIGIADLSPEEITLMQQAWGKDELSEEDLKMLYSRNEPLIIAAQRVISGRMGLSWSTFGHSAADITTTAVGVGAEDFAGSYHLTNIPHILFKMMNRGK